ncbi:MAG: hypothetical protein VXZ82_07060 [Planctomycetota bacterium]|nr:hypothetical protein [Planctomycetota bacterium]
MSHSRRGILTFAFLTLTLITQINFCSIWCHIKALDSIVDEAAAKLSPSSNEDMLFLPGKNGASRCWRSSADFVCEFESPPLVAYLAQHPSTRHCCFECSSHWLSSEQFICPVFPDFARVGLVVREYPVLGATLFARLNCSGMLSDRATRVLGSAPYRKDSTKQQASFSRNSKLTSYPTVANENGGTGKNPAVDRDCMDNG